MRLFGPKQHKTLRVEVGARARIRADEAMKAMDAAIVQSRSLTDRLQAVYADKGRDGFKAFVSDVALSDQLARYAREGLKE